MAILRSHKPWPRTLSQSPAQVRSRGAAAAFKGDEWRQESARAPARRRFALPRRAVRPWFPFLARTAAALAPSTSLLRRTTTTTWWMDTAGTVELQRLREQERGRFILHLQLVVSCVSVAGKGGSNRPQRRENSEKACACWYTCVFT